jgi:apolipoprotein N-acyltransferase
LSTIAARPEAGRAAAGAGWLLWSLPLAGAVLASALPPVGFLPAALAPALLFLVLLGVDGYWRGFAAAWLFAFGFHLAGLYWVGIAFFAEAERFGVLAVPGVLGLAAVLAALGALPLGLLGLKRWRSPWAATLVFAGLWCLSEVVRGRLGVQFPWNPLSLALTAHDATLQPVALLGTTGMSFVLAWLAALVGLAWHGREQRWPAAGLAAALIVALAGFGHWRLTADLALETPADPVHLRLVQGNIAQHHKWDPALRQRWFQRHLDLSVAPGEVQPDVVLWPESSVPYPIEEIAEVRDLVGAVVAPGGHVVLGSNFYDDGTSPPILHNSVYGIAAGGIVQQRYDKVDLVPFGEFLPFRPLFGRLGLEALAVGSIDFVAGAGRVTMALDGLPPFSPLVCFEAAFPGRATDGTGRARWIANVTNDAWFGISSGPHQHAGMARMRSVEAGLPLVRAANTGISLVTDAKGRVLASLPLGAMGTLDAVLPAALATPPLASRAPWLALVLVALALLVAALAERRAVLPGVAGKRD